MTRHSLELVASPFKNGDALPLPDCPFNNKDEKAERAEPPLTAQQRGQVEFLIVLREKRCFVYKHSEQDGGSQWGYPLKLTQ
jgi:hypothetical protein